MAEHLHITHDVLDSAINGVAKARADLEHAQESADSVSHHVGNNPRLTHELQSFAGNWRITRGKLVTSMVALEKNLRGVERSFTEVDHHLADKMGPKDATDVPVHRVPSSPSPSPAAPAAPTPPPVGPISPEPHRTPSFGTPAPAPPPDVVPGTNPDPGNGGDGDTGPLVPDNLHPVPVIDPVPVTEPVPGVPSGPVDAPADAPADVPADVPFAMPADPGTPVAPDSGARSGGGAGSPGEPGTVPSDAGGGGVDVPPAVGDIEPGPAVPTTDDTSMAPTGDNGAAPAGTDESSQHHGDGLSPMVPIGAGAAAMAGIATGALKSSTSDRAGIQVSDSERVKNARSALEELRRARTGTEDPA